MEAAAQNIAATGKWYLALMSGTLRDYQVRLASTELSVNSRCTIVGLRFHMGQANPDMGVPPTTHLILVGMLVK